MLFDETIYPYKGISSISLYMNIDEVKDILDQDSVLFRIELWESSSETIPNPWQVIVIDEKMSLFFAKNNKLFKIVFWSEYSGKLLNGLCTGMNINDAQKIDSTLVFDDWNEDYESQNGYWIEDDVETKKIMSISIFIKEMLDENSFDFCNW